MRAIGGSCLLDPFGEAGRVIGDDDDGVLCERRDLIFFCHVTARDEPI